MCVVSLRTRFAFREEHCEHFQMAFVFSAGVDTGNVHGWKHSFEDSVRGTLCVVVVTRNRLDCSTPDISRRTTKMTLSQEA